MSGARQMPEHRGHSKKTSEDQTALVISDVFFYADRSRLSSIPKDIEVIISGTKPRETDVQKTL